MSNYEFKNIEKKWQDYWEKNETFKAEDKSKKEKKYILGMFPYPSGDGLHVGHPLSYTATDILSKYWRMKGKNVLYPMGWDAFGLPAENYAIKTGVHPTESIAKNIKNFTRQIKALGLGYDWDRELNTSDPEYYKFTQWFFKVLFDNQLAYKKNASVNWCEKDQTVLANEQVVNGCCERCGTPVIQKNLAQWFFKITNFADELLNDLDSLDWPASLKTMQRNWIGRSMGAQITFSLKDSNELFEVFTTRPDTIYGVTYMVLAPEHSLIEKMSDQIKNLKDVKEYQSATQKKSELERTDLNKIKTGVELKGLKAVNPVNGNEIPIYISDYVLTTYGTGAIMAVPAHDERDLEFANKYELAVKPVVDENNILFDSEFLNGLEVNLAIQKIIDYIEEKGIGYGKTNYRLRDWLVSRQRYWGAPIPIVYDDLDQPHSLPDSELPVELPTDVDFRPTGESPLKLSESFNSQKDLARIEKLLKKEGRLDKARRIVRREADTMDTFVCSSWYFFRYCDPKNKKVFADKKLLEKWLPVDTYVGGVEHAVLHLLYARFFTKALNRLGYISFNEPFKQLRNQGLIIGEDGEKMSKSRGNVVNPDLAVDQVGADAFRLFMMFMGPLEDSKPWSTAGLQGGRRFLDKVYGNLSKPLSPKKKPNDDIVVLYNQTVKKVTNDYVNFQFNTAISQLMILNNKISEEGTDQEIAQGFVKLLSPIAPHLGEELWKLLGNKKSIFESVWPEYDEAKTIASVIEIPVQVNSKIRATLMIAPGTNQEEIIAKAMANENVVKYLENKEIRKVVFVQDKIINFIV